MTPTTARLTIGPIRLLQAAHVERVKAGIARPNPERAGMLARIERGLVRARDGRR